MDIEDLLADDGQFKDDTLDILDIDEAALLGSSDDDEETNDERAFEKDDTSTHEPTTAYHFSENSSAKRTRSAYFNDDDKDVLEVDINTEVDDELEGFSPEHKKDVKTPGPPKKIKRYTDNLISVTLLSESSVPSRDVERIPIQDTKQEIDDTENEPSEIIRTTDVSSDNLGLDEESDDESFDNDRRRRFQSERSKVSVCTSSKNKLDIPDSLDSVLSKEETLKVTAFLENQQRKKFQRFNRGQFRGKNQQYSRPNIAASGSYVRAEKPTSPVVKTNAPTKIHINPHFRPNANAALAAMCATQNFSSVGSSMDNTSNYAASHQQPNYAYNNAPFQYSENERFSQPVTQLPPPSLSTSAIGSVSTYHQNVPPPNMHTLPSTMLQPPPSNYLHSSPPNSYAPPVANVIQNAPPPPPLLNQPPVSNVWINPPVSVTQHPILEAPPRYNYPNSVGFNSHVENSYGMNNYQAPPLHQPPERLPAPNLYHANPPTSSWYQEQRLPQPPITVRPQPQINNPTPIYSHINAAPRSAPAVVTVKYQNTAPRYSPQASKPTEQKRFSQLQIRTRKLIKRSANIAYGNQGAKKFRFDDSRKNSNTVAVKTNYNIKQIPLLDNLPVQRPPQKPKPPVVDDEDEETREYRKKIEQQKRIREAFLKQKEERRKLMAVQRLQELQNRKSNETKNVNVVPIPVKVISPVKCVTSEKKNISWKQPQRINVPLKPNTPAPPNKPQRIGVQKEISIQNSMPSQTSTVIDLRSKISGPGKVNFNQNTRNKQLVKKGVISLVPKKQAPGSPSTTLKTVKPKLGINVGNKAQGLSKTGSVTKPSNINLPPPFKKPLRPMHQNRNQNMHNMHYRDGRFSGNQFMRPHSPTGFPAQEALFPQFQMHMMRGPQFQNQRFRVNPGNNNRMPLMQFPDSQAKFLLERPPMLLMDQHPHNFNPRLHGHMINADSQDFLTDRARMPPPRFFPPQNFPQRLPHPQGMMMPPPRHHGVIGKKNRGFPRGGFQKSGNKFKGKASAVTPPVMRSAPVNPPPPYSGDKVTLAKDVTAANERITAVEDRAESDVSSMETKNTAKTVIVNNLSSSTTDAQLQKMSSAIGPVEDMKHDPTERTATITFKDPVHAFRFQSKYKRFMLDLSLIEVILHSS